MLVGAGKTEGSMDAANMLKPALARGEMKFVGATTSNEYRKYIEVDGALARRFQTIFVGEPSVQDSISILRGIKHKYEIHHGVRIQDQAVIAANTYAKRYLTERKLPDSAIDLLDEACSRLRYVCTSIKMRFLIRRLIAAYFVFVLLFLKINARISARRNTITFSANSNTRNRTASIEIGRDIRHGS